MEIDSRAGLYDIDSIREAMTEIIELELGHADDALLAEYVSRAAIAWRRALKRRRAGGRRRSTTA